MKEWNVRWRQTFNVTFHETIVAATENSAINKAKKLAKELDVSDYTECYPDDEADDFIAWVD